jgi:mannose-6-phosphate isomerase-like protein (cupin superfamily)
MFYNLTKSQRDIVALETFDILPKSSREDSPRNSYESITVEKPWGYEFLLCETESVGLWALYIGFNHQTSMHCHPEKLTMMLCLSDSFVISFLDGNLTLNSGDIVYIQPGVFHRTTSLNTQGGYLLEFETPVDKLDLVRLDDSYGRNDNTYEIHPEKRSELNSQVPVQWLKHNQYTSVAESVVLGSYKIRFFDIQRESDSATKLFTHSNFVVFMDNPDNSEYSWEIHSGFQAAQLIQAQKIDFNIALCFERNEK